MQTAGVKASRLGPPQRVPHDPEWLLISIASEAASALPAILASHGSPLAAALHRANGRYLPGVRRSHRFGDHPCTPPPKDAKFTFGEIFAGIGGFRLGLEPLGGRCVCAVEIDAAAQETYALNFGRDELRGDIVDEYAEDMPAMDLLTAGFPCQTFSQRGEQAGFDDPRGELFLELARILTVRQPRAFLFENVAQLVTLDGGWRPINGDSSHEGSKAGGVLTAILAAFEAAGYVTRWRLLSSERWVAQKRLRLYIVGIRSDLAAAALPRFEWPSDEVPDSGRGRVLRDLLEPPDAPDVARATLTAEQWARICSDKFCAKSQRGPACRELDLDAPSPTIVSSYRKFSSLTTKYVCEERDGTPRALPRFLTWRECAALMGFPPEFALPAAKRSTAEAITKAESSASSATP